MQVRALQRRQGGGVGIAAKGLRLFVLIQEERRVIRGISRRMPCTPVTCARLCALA